VLRIFFRPKNPTASAGFEPANLGTKGQNATPRSPKPHPSPIWDDNIEMDLQEVRCEGLDGMELA
jgi:hypothetical protein